MNRGAQICSVRCSCNRKTRDLRRAIVARLRTVFGGDAVQRRAPDDRTAPDILAPHLAVSCARSARTDARRALKEARARRRYPDEWAVAVCKDDGERPYVVLTLTDFIALLDAWHSARRAPGASSSELGVPATLRSPVAEMREARGS